MSDLVSLEIQERGSIVVARLQGEVDMSNAKDLERAILAEVPNTAAGMVLNVSDVTYVDSAGINVLLSLAARFSWRGQELGVVAPEGSRTNYVLSLVGADKKISIHQSAEEARSSFGQAANGAAPGLDIPDTGPVP